MTTILLYVYTVFSYEFSFAGSMSGHRMIQNPSFMFYTATKFAVTALTEGVRVELRQKKSKIRVTVSQSLHDVCHCESICTWRVLLWSVCT